MFRIRCVREHKGASSSVCFRLSADMLDIDQKDLEPDYSENKSVFIFLMQFAFLDVASVFYFELSEFYDFFHFVEFRTKIPEIAWMFKKMLEHVLKIPKQIPKKEHQNS